MKGGENMKAKTIENYVRYTDIPYPTIIDRAIKQDWNIVEDVKNEMMVIYEKTTGFAVLRFHNKSEIH